MGRVAVDVGGLFSSRGVRNGKLSISRGVYFIADLGLARDRYLGHKGGGVDTQFDGSRAPSILSIKGGCEVRFETQARLDLERKPHSILSTHTLILVADTNYAAGWALRCVSGGEGGGTVAGQDMYTGTSASTIS